jgi:acetyl-CoA carboxylase biotin carboxyl carrier protein
MRLAFIKKLIKLVEESDIDTLEITRWGRGVRIEKGSLNSKGRVNSIEPSAVEKQMVSVPTASKDTISEESAPVGKTPEKPGSDFLSIKAPMVGTFYRAPSPDAPPYAEVGNVVSKGQVLCIIEAMKLMNEIQSEVDGTIRKIMVENAEPVEYGQELFLIEP